MVNNKQSCIMFNSYSHYYVRASIRVVQIRECLRWERGLHERLSTQRAIQRSHLGSNAEYEGRVPGRFKDDSQVVRLRSGSHRNTCAARRCGAPDTAATRNRIRRAGDRSEYF